jgi:hypothetical protein
MTALRAGTLVFASLFVLGYYILGWCNALQIQLTATTAEQKFPTSAERPGRARFPPLAAPALLVFGSVTTLHDGTTPAISKSAVQNARGG